MNRRSFLRVLGVAPVVAAGVAASAVAEASGAAPAGVPPLLVATVPRGTLVAERLRLLDNLQRMDPHSTHAVVDEGVRVERVHTRNERCVSAYRYGDPWRDTLDGCCSIGLPDDWATDALEQYLETHPRATVWTKGLQFRERVEIELRARRNYPWMRHSTELEAWTNAVEYDLSTESE